MESVKSVKSIVVICLMLSLVAGRSEAFNWLCYAGCFAECSSKGNYLINCAAECLPACVMAQFPLDNNNPMQNKLNFCKLGCATSLCTKFGTKQDPAVKKVAKCVDSCGMTCNN